MKNYYFGKGTVILLCVFLSLTGCASREPEIRMTLDNQDFVSGKDIKKENGEKIQCKIGNTEATIIIDAEVITPDSIKTGKVQTEYPDVGLIEKTLCEGVKMEEIGDNQWGVKAVGQQYDYEKYYAIDDDYAIYYNAAIKSDYESSEEIEKEKQENLKKQVEQLFEECKYSAQIMNHELNGKNMTLFCSPTIHQVPVVSSTAGLGGTQVYISENGVSEILFENQYCLGSHENTNVLSVDTTIKILENHYDNGEISPLNKNDSIKYIRLAYYVNEQLELKPVWCFSIDFMGTGREYVVYCLDAMSGDIIFDYNNYAVEGEGD